ncbi:TetR/AcrR family transcriptional regulator [Nocardia brevicatena]|uniref:TetR/AcrR family transcriptional regulator n=1 Tax=Nocardia brevicatena TaxID=37327 RepID=UPI001FE1143C|nr:TetR/AcrR family transcriptional regulator [Nocardia brevicatena]
MVDLLRRRRAGGGRRAELLAVVVEVLVERGVDRTRFQDVAQRAGVAVSTLQGHFGSRVDMLVEALQRSTDAEVSVMNELAAAETDPWARLEALVDRGLGTPVPVWRMLMEFWYAAAHDDELRSHSVGLQQRYRQPFVDAVQLGCERGSFTPRRNPDAVVDTLIAALDGVLFPSVLSLPRPEPAEVRAVMLDQLSYLLGVRS